MPDSNGMAEFDKLASRENTRVVSNRVDTYIWSELASIANGDEACIQDDEAITVNT